MLVRLIAPEWALAKNPRLPRTIEGVSSLEEIVQYNAQGYNVYYFPNGPKEYIKNDKYLEGSQVDDFQWVFVDMDLKEGAYLFKESFLEKLTEFMPTKVIDSGNGVHAYWKVTDLDAKSYLRLSRRLMRFFNTDEAVGKLLQLMRLEGTINTKQEGNQIPCTLWYESDTTFTCEEIHKFLPPITMPDEEYCTQHYNTTYKIETNKVKVKMPAKWGKLLGENEEVKRLWVNLSKESDRSKNDYRLGHIMFGNGFSTEEATTVLANTAKALGRSNEHQLSYAKNIIEKIWTYELEPEKREVLAESVADIIKKAGTAIKGTEFRCHKRIDNTVHGFRLGQVIGLVAGSGVGKTAFALNMFKWFAETNPTYHHFFVPLEQPSNEIALRWQTMCGKNTNLHSKVHVMSNYDDDGNFRHLSLEEIKDYIVRWQKETGNKLGCVVIDHIGALKKKGKTGENQDLMDICHSMKAFAVQTNTLLVMQSQTTRAKAGIGDLELDKDAAYGTVYFESYCDFLVTIWQPLKRCSHEESCPTVTAFKFCKIRHKKPKKDVIKEDVPYYFAFDSETELLQDMTQLETEGFKRFLIKATNLRKADKKTDLLEYKAVPYQEGDNGTVIDTRQAVRH